MVKLTAFNLHVYEAKMFLDGQFHEFFCIDPISGLIDVNTINSNVSFFYNPLVTDFILYLNNSEKFKMIDYRYSPINSQLIITLNDHFKRVYNSLDDQYIKDILEYLDSSPFK